MKEYLTDVGEVMKNENSSLAGLTTAEAEKRAEKYGKNKLKAAKKVPRLCDAARSAILESGVLVLRDHGEGEEKRCTG